MMPVRQQDRRRRAKRSGQLWRHLRAAMRLVLRHPISSVAIVPVLPDGRIVLARRVDTDQWVLPGGMIDWGETVEASAVRELAEETGLELVGPSRLVGVYSSPRRDPRSHSIVVLIVAEARGVPSIADTMEVSEVHAFAEDELPFDNMGFGMDAMLRDHLAGRTVLA
jgi:8-oxo-dGTP diphosphatase